MSTQTGDPDVEGASPGMDVPVSRLPGSPSPPHKKAEGVTVVLVSWGHNELSQLGGLQQKCILSPFWRPEV